ncbi:MAG: carboxypeptidase-like regulatory domain-containing protein [Bacteroidetes bacterium]|nr:carboxypeptidase-like regulatory domain-containing protein [Bacteroidota bacterium]
MNRQIYRLFTLALFILLAGGIQAQGFTVKGNVLDEESNFGIPGASVIEKGTLNGTITDIDGNYTITVKDGQATLEFAYVGYESQTIAVNDQPIINVVMGYELTELNEVIVIGYGTQ